MASLRTEITEIMTGLGMLGVLQPGEALRARPALLRGVSPGQWTRLEQAWQSGAQRSLFEQAWRNGRAFFAAEQGLRLRTPLLVEWKGSHRDPSYDPLPVDLRVDHVYLVSCKYHSRILANTAPAHLFERALAPGEGRRSEPDWYAACAPDAYAAFYAAVRLELGGQAELPERLADLRREHRSVLKKACSRRWPGTLPEAYRTFSRAVAWASAKAWNAVLRRPRQRLHMLWRLLRLSSAPYFVLGARGQGEPLRLRICTPWDWQQRYELRSLAVQPQAAAGQPAVAWTAEVHDRVADEARPVEGHVEVRWSHGRFGGNPEAKVYLDTPATEVPGYEPLL